MHWEYLLNNYEEAVAMILFGIGFSNLLLQKNLIKKIIGLNIMDTATYLFLALKGYIADRKMARNHPCATSSAGPATSDPATRRHPCHPQTGQNKEVRQLFLPKNLPIPKKITYFALCFVAPP